MKNTMLLILILCLPVMLLLPHTTQAQTPNVYIKSGATVTVTGAASIVIKDGGLVNDGTYTKGTETVTFSGTTASTISGSSNTAINNLSITNTGGITTQMGLLTTNNLTIDSKLTVDPVKAVTVLGTTTLNLAQCLVLKSTASGTASFIDNGTISGSGTMNAKRFLAPYNATNDQMFHFLSSPVVNQAIVPVFSNPPTMSGTDFYAWDEIGYQWINARATGDVWNSSFEANFVQGKGYLVAYPADVTKDFVGTPYTNSTGLNIICTKTLNKGNGWNLLGNPFPSSIDWDLVTKGAGVDAALYYYDNAAANYRYYIDFSGGLSGGTKDIPSMQGFMVHANTDGAQITIKNGDRTHLGLNQYYKSAMLASNILDLKVEGNGYNDYARVCFYNNATSEFDGEYDAFKMWSYNAKVPQIYMVTPTNAYLAINTLPVTAMESGTIPVSFKASQDGNFTITAEQLSTFSPNTSIALEDKIAGTIQRLNNNPVYTFSATQQDAPDRFVLRFMDVTAVSDPKTTKDFTVYAAHRILNIQSLNQLGGKVMVTDMVGRTIATGRIEAGATTQISMHGNTGVYIVSVITGKGRSNIKVIVK